jgi:protein required for attachment to host cells
MIHARKVLYLLTDGGHAKLVERSRETGDFVTLKELNGAPALEALRHELRASPPARSMESMSPARHAVGPDDHYARAKASFAEDAAEAAAELAGRGGYEGVVAAAPAKLVGPVRACLEKHGVLLGIMSKDLVHTPNHELPGVLAEGP